MSIILGVQVSPIIPIFLNLSLTKFSYTIGMNCCGFFKSRQMPRAALDWTSHKLSSQKEKISEYLDDRKVRKIDYIFNMCGTVLGVGLIAFAIALFLMTHNVYGWNVVVAPFYALMGGVGIVGGILTLVSIKWMIDSCKKSSRNDSIMSAALS